jgi:Leucine-rich repeat (LRR) protein
LVSVSSELGDLVSLKQLDLSHNKIKLLPIALCKLTNLTALNVMGNELKELPETIGNLSSLRCVCVVW